MGDFVNFILPFAISLFLFSSGVCAESDQRVLLNRDGEAVCRLADKVNLSWPQALRVEAESLLELDECNSHQILSALAEVPPEEIRAASVSALPIALGLGAAPMGCLMGMEAASPEDVPKSYFKQQLATIGIFSVVGSSLAFLHLTGREFVHMVKASKISPLPRKSYLAALAGLGAGAFGTSFLCYILN